jgi:hypothetical protein
MKDANLELLTGIARLFGPGDINSYRWEQHRRGLFQLPIAA